MRASKSGDKMSFKFDIRPNRGFKKKDVRSFMRCNKQSPRIAQPQRMNAPRSSGDEGNPAPHVCEGGGESRKKQRKTNVDDGSWTFWGTRVYVFPRRYTAKNQPCPAVKMSSFPKDRKPPFGTWTEDSARVGFCALRRTNCVQLWARS